MKVSINTKELELYKKRLDKMGRSDFPLAVRGALNETAFQNKTKDLKNEFNEDFTIRRRTFLPSHSAFNRCQNTFDINKMFSEAGVTDKDRASMNLKLQEDGGFLSDRAVPTVKTRKNNRGAYIQLEKFHFKNFKGKKNGFIDKVEGGVITKTNKAITFHPTGARRFNGKTGKPMKSKKGYNKPVHQLYYLQRGIRIKQHSFVKPSAIVSAKNVQLYFIKQAEKRFKLRY
jgi:hypothetical protein